VFNYRFMQGWILDSGGNIEPIFAKGGLLIVGSNIGANGHNHYLHLYWRIDFDIGAPGNDVLQQYARAAGGFQAQGAKTDLVACLLNGMVAATVWCDTPVETKLARDPLTHGKWRVRELLAHLGSLYPDPWDTDELLAAVGLTEGSLLSEDQLLDAGERLVEEGEVTVGAVLAPQNTPDNLATGAEVTVVVRSPDGSGQQGAEAIPGWVLGVDSVDAPGARGERVTLVVPSQYGPQVSAASSQDRVSVAVRGGP
jgi:hypothetical protein